MEQRLHGRTIAILVADGFEEEELTAPRQALEAQGADPLIVSPNADRVRSWRHTDWGVSMPVDVPLRRACASDFDSLVLPGGVMNPDKLRMNEDAVRFIKAFVAAGKPVAAICHGPWPLIDAEAVKGRRMTSYRSLKIDLENAGANWVDEAVVVDRGFVTSRTPKDLPMFIEKMIEEFEEGIRSTRLSSSSPEMRM